MTEPNFQILPIDTQLAALKQAVAQVTKDMIEQNKATEKSRSNIYSEILKTFYEATTQTALDNSYSRAGKRGCISDAANLIGVNRATLATRVKRFDIKLTPMDEDIPQ